ncbi:hypothetical protein P692DRAFT_201800218 [Suillus brevipes Sb2]|nr:hypothetical protein P692DRAFT_201800218 [Suillus brevipes Sb2]
MSSEGSTWIAVGTRDKIVQVIVLNTNSQLEAIFAVRLDNTVLKSVAFAVDKGVYVFGLYNGNFIKLKDDGTVVKEYSCKSVIGHAAVNQKRGVFMVDNATDGFTLYRLRISPKAGGIWCQREVGSNCMGKPPGTSATTHTHTRRNTRTLEVGLGFCMGGWVNDPHHDPSRVYPWVAFNLRNT